MRNLSLHNIIYALAVIIFCAVLAPSCSFADGLEDFGIDMEIKNNYNKIYGDNLSPGQLQQIQDRDLALTEALNPGGNSKQILNESLEKYFQRLKCTDSDNACAPYCKYESTDQCLLCPLFIVVFNTVSTITATAVSAFSSSVAKVVIVAFGVWLAIQILAFVASIETRDLKDLIQSIITQGFIVVLAFFILSTGVVKFFNTFVNPIYQTGLSLADTMFSSCENGSCPQGDEAVVKVDTSGVKYESNGLPAEMGISIVNTMTMMENYVRKFKALGSSFMCQSWKEGFLFIPKFSYLLTGLALWAFSMLLIIGVPFLMVDAVLQLGVAGALLPFAVGCFAFKSTRQYCKKVWETFLNSMFAFLFITIVVLILLGTIKSAVTEGAGNITAAGVNFDSMFLASSAGDTAFDAILKQFGWFTFPFLKLVFIFILAWSVMNMAKEFANEFASSMSSTSIGSSIGTMAASTAKGMALKASKPLATKAIKGVGYATKETFKGAARGIRRITRSKAEEFVNNARERAINNNASNSGRQGQVMSTADQTQANKNGQVTDVQSNKRKTVITNVEGNATSVVTMKKGRKVSEVKQENGVVTNIKHNKDGSRVEVERSQHFTITRRYDEKGNQVGETKVKANTLTADRLVTNPTGEFRKQELDNMTKGMTDKQKESTFSAVAQKINKNRINANNRKGRIISQEVIACDYEAGYVEIKKTTNKGEVIFEKIEVDSNNNIVKGSITTVSAKGKVTIFTSDGIHNKLEKFRIDREQVKNLNKFDDIASKREKDADGKVKKSKVAYGYTKWYRDALEHGLDPREIAQGMFSKEEAEACYAYHVGKGNEMGKAEMGWSFH